MLDVLLWYLTVFMIGWLTFPLGFRLFSFLGDRGFAFYKIFGILLWGYLFWIMAILQLLHNNIGDLIFALLVLIGVNLWVLRKLNLEEIKRWLREHRRYVVAVELLYLFSFVLWSLVRAANPEILGTEKPMELAFINAIIRSPTFPPHDPWLSGYAISYYYFGYVLVAMLAKFLSVTGSVAFNLGIAMIFALSASGSYGMVYNLLSKHKDQQGNKSVVIPVLGPIFILLVGNLGGFLEILHARGLFWAKSSGGDFVSPFWRWVDLVELSRPPSEPLSWLPDRYLWWWRASRVVQDYDLQNNLKEVINEFPAFSYLLADLHPHVLAMPFAFLAMAVSMQLYMGALNGNSREKNIWVSHQIIVWAGSLGVVGGITLLWLGGMNLDVKYIIFGLIGVIGGLIMLLDLLPVIRKFGVDVFFNRNTGEKEVHIPVFLDLPTTIISALILGGLSFLNTWDFPFYVALAAVAYLAGKIQSGDNSSENTNHVTVPKMIKEFFWSGMFFGAYGGFLYLPFYLSFSSQAGGIIPNLIYPTRGIHLWVMFAPLLIPLFLFYIYFIKADKRFIRQGFILAGGIFMFLWLASWLFGLMIIMIPGVGGIYLDSLAASNTQELFRQAFLRRMISNGGWITLLIFFAFTLALLFRCLHKPGFDCLADQKPAHENTYLLLMVLLGILLVVIPEFFYLRDQFGWRINTIFKFYYQAWLLWGVAAAYATSLLLQKPLGKGKNPFRIGISLLIFMSLCYLVFGVWEKTNGFNPFHGWTLDGSEFYRQQSPDEMAAIEWLQSAPMGVVAEAVSPTGGSYSGYARVSTFSGLPAVLGWTGHESQWRGGAKEMGSRQVDMELLYCTRYWDEAYEILQRYQIRYVYVGSLERATYLPGQGNCKTGLNEIKFGQAMPMVFQQGDVTIYALR